MFAAATAYGRARFLGMVRRRHGPPASPPDSFEAAHEWMRAKTRCGRYLALCFDRDGLTTTGNRMKRFLNRQGFALGTGPWPVLEFLMDRDDAALKGLFGRKFLTVGRRTVTAYNRFVQVHGMGNAHLWGAMDDAERAKYRAEDVRPRPPPGPARPNTWALAVKEWHRRFPNRAFRPIRAGSREYHEIRAIQGALAANHEEMPKGGAKDDAEGQPRDEEVDD